MNWTETAEVNDNVNKHIKQMHSGDAHAINPQNKLLMAILKLSDCVNFTPKLLSPFSFLFAFVMQYNHSAYHV